MVDVLNEGEVSRLHDLKHKEASGGYTPSEKEELALLREKRDGIIHGEDTHTLTEDEIPTSDSLDGSLVSDEDESGKNME